ADGAAVAVGGFTEAWLRTQLAESDLGSALAASGATEGQVDELVNSLLGDPENATATVQAWIDKVLPETKRLFDEARAQNLANQDGALFSVAVENQDDIDAAAKLYGELWDFATVIGNVIAEQAHKIKVADFFGAVAGGASEALDAYDAVL